MTGWQPIESAYPMPKEQILDWYKAKLTSVRRKYPDIDGNAHPKVREFAELFLGPNGYMPILAWLQAEDIEPGS